jgi:hypothetical protein
MDEKNATQRNEIASSRLILTQVEAKPNQVKLSEMT